MHTACALFFLALISISNEFLLPSSDLYNVCDELLGNDAMQANVELTADQELRIDALLGSLEVQGPLQQKRSDEQRLLVNPIIEQKLSVILSEKQLTSVKTQYLVFKFPFPYSPFQSKEVLNVCGVGSDVRKNLAIAVADAKKRTDNAVSELRKNAVNEIVVLLPERSKRKFVHYAGQRYFPEIPIEDDFPTNSIPFPATSKSVFTLATLASGDLMARLALSDSDAEKLLSIQEKADSDFMKAPGKNTVLQKANDEMIAVLGKAKWAIAIRELASVAFEEDFVKPFESPAFTKFLDLTGAEATQLKVVARDEARNMAKEEFEINRRTFYGLVEKLPTDCRAKLKSIFVDIWK